MNKRRLMALILSATMIVGSSLTALAASTSATGSDTGSGDGTNEGITDTEIYSVTLPTVAANMFDFYLDPDSNIEDTAAARYSGFTATNTTNGYFKTTSSTMTADSAEYTISNGSYQSIDVTMKVEVKGATNLAIADDTETNAATVPTMFMALVADIDDSGSPSTDYVPSTAVLEKTFTLGDDSADYTKAFESDKYVWKSTKTAHDDPKLVFNLSVGCNTVETSDGKAIDWSSAVEDSTSVEVTWSYKKHVDTPAVAYTEHAANGVWSTDLWLSIDGSNGFGGTPDAVEISVNDGAFSNITYSGNDFISLTWTNIAAKLTDATNDKYTIRVTVGTDRYSYSNK